MTTIEQIETVLAKLRSQPEARQQAALAALQEIASEPYQLDETELAILRPARDEALRGENLCDADTDDILNEPWG